MLASVIPSLKKGTWFKPLDLKKAYFHVDIHLSHKVLQISGETRTLLVQRTGNSTRVFRKVFSVVAAPMRNHNCTIFPYLDSWLLTGRSSQEVQSATLCLLHLLSALGICVNTEKSTLTPTRTRDFIGATLDLTSAGYYLTMESFQGMNILIRQVTLKS